MPLSQALESKRLSSGHFAPGQSGNPEGRVRRLSIAQLCRNLTPKAVKTLEYWLDQREHPAQSVRAIEIILERGYGKAVQPVADGSNHEALELDLDGLSVAQLSRLEATFSKLIPRMRQIQDAPIDVVPEPVPDAAE